MSQNTLVLRGQKTRIPYQLIRNVTSPEEKANNVFTYIANVAPENIADVSTEDNLRTYIPAHQGKKRNMVHKAIQQTIESERDRFINRNSGITITCSAVSIDDKRGVAELTNASIINGAQTQGELRYYLENQREEGDWPITDFHVRVEINVDPDHSSVVETAIARNTATGVQSISQAGARGHLDELAAVLKGETGRALRKSETDVDVIETLQVLQFTRLLMPPEVSGNDSVSEMLRPYKQKSKCLEDFSSWRETIKNFEAAEKTPVGASDELRADAEDARRKYQFVLDMASTALSEYHYWENHNAWNHQRLWEETKKGGRACRRDAQGKIAWISPGLLFPVLNALSPFVKRDETGKWFLDKPKLFRSEEMVKKAVAQFRGLQSSPMLMGRSEGAYEALLTYPQTIEEVMRDQALAMAG